MRHLQHIETRQPFAEEYFDGESEEGGQVDLDDEPPIVSFRDAKYESAEMKQLLSLSEPDEKLPAGADDVNYRSSKVFPDWVLKNSNWKSTAKLNEEAQTVSDILKMDKNKRNPDQNAMVIKWLMSVWKIAFSMGFKRCGSMLKAFEYVTYQPGEHIIEEGKRGLTFYIIISGETHVHKDGIGIVGQLGQGKSFGEVALTQGNDLRTATVTAVTNVECVRLHKSSFDYYVRDIQDQEKRENFKVLSDCKLFRTWPKGKIEKMSNSCQRKCYDAGDYIFHQGDPPTDLCIIVEGNVNIVKELVIVCKNRWPVANREWKERTKRIHKPITLKTLGISDFFGEVAILKDQPRSTSAIASNRCVLLSLDRNEFLHLISYGNSNIDGSSIDEEDRRFNDIISKYIDDQDILDSVAYFRGGPDSAAVVGDKIVYKHDLEATREGQKKAPPPGASKAVVIVGPTSHSNVHKQSYSMKQKPTGLTITTTTTATAGTGTGSGAGQEDVDMSLTLQEQLAKGKRADSVAERLRQTAAQSLLLEKEKIDKLKSLGVAVPKGASGLLLPVRNRAASPGQGQGQTKKGRQASMVNQNGLIYRKASAATGGGAGRRGSLSFAQRRTSLQGVDNDPTFVYDPVVLLRKNSAIHLGKVYEHVQRHLQAESDAAALAAGADPAYSAGMGGGGGMGKGFYGGAGSRGSAKLAPIRRQSGMAMRPPSPPHVDALQLMSQWSSYMDSGGVINNSLSQKIRNTRKNSGFWSQVGAGPGSPSSAGPSSGSIRRRSTANPQIFGPPPSSSPHGGGTGLGGFGGMDGGRLLSAGDISASMKNRAPFSSKGRSVAWQDRSLLEEEGEDTFGFEDHGREIGLSVRRGSQPGLTRDTSLKILNKAKLSYREIMEG